MLEAVCNENGADREHWVGKASDDKRTEVKVAPEVLAKYAGTYRELDPWGQGRHPRMIEITVSDGMLFAELKGRGKEGLVAQSGNHVFGLF